MSSYDSLKPSYPGDGPGHRVLIQVGTEKARALIPIKDRETGEPRMIRKWYDKKVEISFVWDGKDWILK